MNNSTGGASPDSRRDELYYFGVIEGALHAKGEDAYSVKVWHALRMLGKLLGVPTIMHEDLVIPAKVERAIAAMKDMAEAVTEEGRGATGNRWLPWQVNLLREMKGKNEPVSAIATAVEKSATQVNNKWFQLRNGTDVEDASRTEAA
jgi:hypothetical protein